MGVSIESADVTSTSMDVYVGLHACIIEHAQINGSSILKSNTIILLLFNLACYSCAIIILWQLGIVLLLLLLSKVYLACCSSYINCMMAISKRGCSYS